ncbi:MAG: metallophosphoesterase [Gammaproteobacteria bacterium]|nr:metallophosphoesterase [Gammaproteobacteria bacterium]
MLIAITGDGHCDERSRFDEWKRIHDWMADDWRARGIRLVLNAGDLYERRSTPDERNAMAAWVRKVGQFAEQVIIRGNHDVMHDLLLLSQLDTEHEVRVLEHPEVVCTRDASYGRVLVACMPWPRKAGVLAHAAQLGLGSEGAELLAHEALQQILRGLGDQMDSEGDLLPRILLSHAMVRAAVTSVGQPLVGCDMEVGLEDLRLARADIYALGHVHMPQLFAGKPGSGLDGMHGRAGDVFYTGSPRRTAFGEIESKSYVLYDTETKTWERIETPCAPMILLTSEWNDRSFDFSGDDFADLGPIEPRTEIRFRFTCASEQRGGAMHAAEQLKKEWLALGAASVVIEAQTLTTSTVKAPEVAEAHGLPDKLDAMWRLREEDVSSSRRGRLLDKLTTIEAELP